MDIDRIVDSYVGIHDLIVNGTREERQALGLSLAKGWAYSRGSRFEEQFDFVLAEIWEGVA